MEIKILNEHRNMYYYTIVGEKVPNIYSMQVNVVMLRIALDDFHGHYVKDATFKQIEKVLADNHETCSKPLPFMDIFEFASDPEFAPMVNKIYEAQRKLKNETAIIPINHTFIFLTPPKIAINGLV